MKNRIAITLSAAVAFVLLSTPPRVHAQANAGPQLPSAGPNPSQILNLPTSPNGNGAGAKNTKPPAGMPAQPEDSLRDPFWPIGYMAPSLQPDVPTNVPVVPETPGRDWDQAMKGLGIKGIIKSGTSYLANINNKIIGAGDTVSLYYDSQKYVWRVTTITAKKVSFQPDIAESEKKEEEKEAE